MFPSFSSGGVNPQGFFFASKENVKRLCAAMLLRALADIEDLSLPRQEQRFLMRWVLCGEGGIGFEKVCAVLGVDETKVAKWFVQKAIENGVNMPRRASWKIEVYEGRVGLTEAGLVKTFRR